MHETNIKCVQTTQHIADKILLLRRAHKLTQEQFAEKVGLDRRTIARAEEGKHRPSPETMELIVSAFKVPISYLFDNSVYKTDISKQGLINQINAKLNILSKNNLKKVISFIDIIDNN